MRRSIGDWTVHGIEVGPETRCAHFGSERDIIALRFGCCERFYPCYACHETVTDHDASPWPRERFDEPAVLCGRCGTALTAAVYLSVTHECPSCGAAFNPGCETHHDRYFESE